MSREQPTPEELDAIEQHQYGAYGVELPAWYLTPEDAREVLEDKIKGARVNISDEAVDPLTVPTNEYSMRHAANELIHLVNRRGNLSREDLEVIDFAYNQLQRGANTLHAAQDRSAGAGE